MYAEKTNDGSYNLMGLSADQISFIRDVLSKTASPFEKDTIDPVIAWVNSVVPPVEKAKQIQSRYERADIIVRDPQTGRSVTIGFKYDPEQNQAIHSVKYTPKIQGQSTDLYLMIATKILVFISK